MNPRCAIQCVLTCLNKMLFNLDSLCWCLILFRLKMLQCDTWILHSPTYSLDLPLKVISFCQDHFSHAQEWESMIFSILMEQNVFHKKDLVLPKAMKMRNVTVNHFVHHVPCYTNTIQRIHYGPDCSPLWLILKIISVVARHCTTTQCGSKFLRGRRLGSLYCSP